MLRPGPTSPVPLFDRGPSVYPRVARIVIVGRRHHPPARDRTDLGGT